MSHPTSSVDFAAFQSFSTQGSVYSKSQGSESTDLLLSHVPSPQSPIITQSPSESQLQLTTSDTTTLVLRPSVTVSFNKGSRLFKLRYTHIDVRKDPHGNLRCLELGESPGPQRPFIHTFPNTRLPMPHIEQPIVSSQKSSFAVSFLEEQTVQTGQTLFTAQPHYSFDNWEDCIRFQEILLDQKLLLVAGVEVAKSKGRGEECISQNLRILRAKNGKRTIVLFANSQRKERKGYILIPLDSVDQIHQEKKGGRPVSLTLRPSSELMSQLKTLQIQFLHENHQKRFCEILNQAVSAGVT